MASTLDDMAADELAKLLKKRVVALQKQTDKAMLGYWYDLKEWGTTEQTQDMIDVAHDEALSARDILNALIARLESDVLD